MGKNPAEMAQVENAGKAGVSVEKRSALIDRRISVAPMMDWTDRHCRYFLRGISPDVLLYTEMITATAILRGDRARLLAFDPEEHPLALQLGGSEPGELAAAARAGEEAGYDEVNLNCGCPSERVASGAFGACLMREPARVAECVAAMRAAVRVPVTVKMRIGVVTAAAAGGIRDAIVSFSERDAESLWQFVRSVRDAGCQVAIVHARKAVLGGLSPKENREIPPLRYELVRRLKVDFPTLPVVVNGGLRSPEAVLDALAWCDGVMLGREAYHRPYLLAELQRALHSGAGELPAKEALIARMERYVARELAAGEPLAAITRHMLGLYSGEPGARDFRRALSEGARAAGAGVELLRRAISAAPRPQPRW
jgi:tRNA-dihydrouridine synthase A